MRLIDADALRHKFFEMGCHITKIHPMDVMNIIDAQPTAYDVEKVVEELKTTFEQTVAEILDMTDSEYTIADFNIKPYSNRICNVVKRGGVNNG